MSYSTKTPSSRATCISLASNLRLQIQDLIIAHHWDTDGVLSALLLEKSMDLKPKELLTPFIGQYSADALNLDMRRASVIAIIDYGLPHKEILKIKNKGHKPFVIDHHLTDVSEEYACNPVAGGASEKEYPSTTWVIYKEILGGRLEDAQQRLLVAGGLTGDLGEKIKLYPQHGFVEKVLLETGLTFKKLLEATDKIDTCYRLGDTNCIREAVQIIREEGLKGILSHDYFEEKKRELKTFIAETISNISPFLEKDIIKAFSIETDFYITSLIGRRLAAMYPRHIVVLYHSLPSFSSAYIYVRSDQYKIGKCIENLREKGLIVGGKESVFVVTCNNNCHEILEHVVGMIPGCMD